MARSQIKNIILYTENIKRDLLLIGMFFPVSFREQSVCVRVNL